MLAACWQLKFLAGACRRFPIPELLDVSCYNLSFMVGLLTNAATKFYMAMLLSRHALCSLQLKARPNAFDCIRVQ